ncbi:macrophage mannose receptor 1-like [Dreissena polymorpha]|uniref:C-type lectin domain-containing protein n=1 Tax=Dreissena polymorpha TaxID=45954 RepID=A0A9D4GX01_DREPO|nr:macrophage mannose receptor 1-like [Dreissena polymorpha]XP_052211824.1 macrophage mannose receptor 1-like [Dreissena polymorpha]KAH3821447.1 hypothetical protein DPMN_123211 [Dreissena polymorpha]
MDTHFSLVVALATFRMSNGDYSCICNYNQDIAVYNETSNSSFLMGHMYEFDCKAAGSPTGMAGWASVLFQHQLGYVQLVDNMEQQSCPGATPIGDDLTTSNPPTIQTTTTEDLTTLLPTTTTPVPTTLPPSTAAPFTSVQTDQSTTATTTQPPTTAAPSTTVMTDQATTTTTSTYLSPVAGVHYGCEETLFLHAASHDSKLFTISQTCYELVREAVSWTDAENDCKSRGGHLVHIENDEQQNKIYEVVKQYHDDHVWIGLNDREHEETFVWSSGNSVNYTHWYPGRKTNLPLNEDCVAMWMDHGGQWEDVHCSPNLLYNAHAYVCEFDAINDMMTTTPDENSLINTDGIM